MIPHHAMSAIQRPESAMKYMLPPMHTLRAFEALGRLRNFTRAAEELHLTTSAVSHQIRSIESFHMVKLFQRNSRAAVLTPAGARLFEVVTGVLQQLSLAADSLRNCDANRLVVTVPPSLASRWLMPRLGAFLQQHPDIDFTLHTTQALVDLDAGEADLGIRYGSGRWEKLHSERLFAEEVFPVASPSFIQSMRLRRLADLKRCTLLRDDFQSWDDWFIQVGMDPSRTVSGPLFSDSALLLQAAESGHGVALARSLLVNDAIAAGLLARIGKRVAPAPNAYYLVKATRRPMTASATAFRRWLSEIAVV